jgi:hypothetical protein
MLSCFRDLTYFQNGFELLFCSPSIKKVDKHAPENYRSVSLTSVSCKLLEHVFYKHMRKHIERHKVLT